MELSIVKILLVDDFVRWHQVVRSLLQPNAELQVISEATNGLEAVEKALELQPDLVLLDIGLPVMNGIEVARHICGVAPSLKIVFLTENSDRAVMKAAMSTGAALAAMSLSQMPYANCCLPSRLQSPANSLSVRNPKMILPPPQQNNPEYS